MPAGKFSFRTLLDSIDEPVVALRKNHQVMYCNRPFAEMVGRLPGEVEGQNLFDLVPELRNTATYAAYMEALATGCRQDVKTQYGYRVFRERIYGTPWGLVSIFEDITAEEKGLKVATLQEGDFQSLAQAVNDALFLHDAHTGDIVFANEKALEMFVYRREQMLNMSMAELVTGHPPYTREEFMKLLKKAFYSQVDPFEWEARDKGGRTFWIQVKPKRVTVGGEDRILTVIQDVTEVRQLKTALRRSEERYQDFFDNSPDILFAHDLEGNFIFVNRAAEKITGYWREELLKMNIEQLVVHDYSQLLRSLVYRKKARQKEDTYELEILTKYNERVVLEISAWPVYRMGKPIAIQGIARNVTQRKQAEAALAESEYIAKLIIDQFPDAVLAINREGRVIVWNKAMEEMTGVKAEEMLGKGDYEYGIPFYGVKRPLMVDVVLRPEEVAKYYQVFQFENYNLISEVHVPKLKGVSSYLWGTAAPLWDSRGQVIGAVESLRDITAQRKLREKREEELQAAAEQIRSVVDSVPLPLWACDAEGKILITNLAFNELLGYQASEIVSKNIGDILEQPDLNSLRQEFLANLKQIEEKQTTLSLRNAQGQVIKLLVRVSPWLQGGNAVGAVFYATPCFD